MLNALTRRGLIAAAPAAAVVASVSNTVAIDHCDAALLALRPAWLKAHEAFDATFKPLADAEKACWPLLTGAMSDHDRAVVEQNIGLSAAKDIQQKACEAEIEIVDKVFGLPAVTRDGILFKFEVLHEFEGCLEPEWDRSLLIDLLLMAGIADA